MLLNRICIHLGSIAKILFENVIVAGIWIYQEERANSVFADALAPHIANSLVAMELTK